MADAQNIFIFFLYLSIKYVGFSRLPCRRSRTMCTAIYYKYKEKNVRVVKNIVKLLESDYDRIFELNLSMLEIYIEYKYTLNWKPKN